MRIAVIGAGALGLYYGALLQRAGNEVLFLLRRDYEAIIRQGLTVRSIAGDFHLDQVRGYRSPGEIGPVDLVLVGLKTFDNRLLPELLPPLLGPGTRVLTLQNGLGNEEALADLWDPGRVLGGVAFLCANRGEPGTVHHLGAGHIFLGAYKQENTSAAQETAQLFRDAGVRCEAVPDLVRARWEKLVWNIPFNGLCALLDKPVDALLAHGRSRQLVADIMGEVVAAANAQELSNSLDEALVGTMITFTEAMGPYRPSMQIDREEGRPLELEAIFARPLQRGKERGVAMPRAEALLALLEMAVGTGG